MYMRIRARIEKIGLLSILLSRKEYGMREKQIEQKLVQEVRKVGGICPKFTSLGFAGMPDRLILLPHGRFAFAELKAPGQKPRPLQAARHKLLVRLGFRVYVIDSPEQIEKIIAEIGGDAE